MIATKRDHISEVIEAADYCVLESGKIILRCPFCPTKIALNKIPLSVEPLTLASHVVGPNLDGSRCDHRFRIEKNEVLEGP
jgi:hypothetical protein